ncbi:MAG: mycothiol synthase [Acidimicrobiales bacterium]|nr:mycothiol synthase [Acidimicrobiales bacterium]
MTAQPTNDARPTAAVSGEVAVPGSVGLSLRYDRRGDATEVELLHGRRPAEDGSASSTTVAAVVGVVGGLRGLPELADSSLQLAADHPVDALDPLPEAVADALGLDHRRDLLQLHRSLPVPADHGVRASAPALAIRPFRPGQDDAAWIRVNNRAFAGHPDQGRESPATLATRTAGTWFDADGFLVADDVDRPGELAGFCWTKVHAASATEPERGEIYVIGVDPSHRGLGLGASFTLAGLDHLAGCGITTAILFVDAHNEPARRLYDRLGFTAHARRRVYTP